MQSGEYLSAYQNYSIPHKIVFITDMWRQWDKRKISHLSFPQCLSSWNLMSECLQTLTSNIIGNKSSKNSCRGNHRTSSWIG